MQALPTSTLVLIMVVPLIAWRMYSRVRRMVGRQRASRIRPWITLVVFPLLVALLVVTALAHPVSLASLAAGLAGGAVLGVYGLRHTVFEPTPQGLFYTPSAPIGIALSVLFIGRVAWRIFEVVTTGGSMPPSGADFGRSPLTLAVFGVLAGYYITYAIGLVRWRARVVAAERAREATAGPTPIRRDAPPKVFESNQPTDGY